MQQISDESSKIDYWMTNVDLLTATAEWILNTYSQTNCLEVLYREALMMVRAKRISTQR